MKKTLATLACGLLAFQQAMSCNVQGSLEDCKDYGQSTCIANCGSTRCTYNGISITYYTGTYVSGVVKKSFAYDDNNPCDGQKSTKPLYAFANGWQTTVANCVATYQPLLISIADCDGTQPDGDSCHCDVASAKAPQNLNLN